MYHINVDLCLYHLRAWGVLGGWVGTAVTVDVCVGVRFITHTRRQPHGAYIHSNTFAHPPHMHTHTPSSLRFSKLEHRNYGPSLKSIASNF